MEPDLAEAIRAVQAAGARLGLELTLFGALASQENVRVKRIRLPHRGTGDADFAVRAPDWGRFQALREFLEAAGFSPHPKIEHRLHLRSAIVDLVPYGPGVATPDGKIVWPRSGAEMVVVGLQDACDHAFETSLAGGTPIRCVSVPGLVLLKFIAYPDRRRKDPAKSQDDARDVFFWLQHYASGEENERRYEILMLGLRDVQFDAAGAAVVGIDVARIASPAAHERVAPFVEEVLSASEHPFVSALLPRTFDWEEQEREQSRVLRLIEAFRAGYTRGRGEGRP